VEARVTLHEEHAELMRRAVSDPNLTRDIDWTDKTFEITETEEQPVVSKTARVVEEVIIRREGSDHVQIVRDTVRRQQVDLERLPKEKEPPSR
jgi:stress response protein YsnF